VTPLLLEMSHPDFMPVLRSWRLGEQASAVPREEPRPPRERPLPAAEPAPRAAGGGPER
jgi:hypothetical protein